MGYLDACALQTFWHTDARKTRGKSQMRATHIPDVRNPFNRIMKWREGVITVISGKQSSRGDG